MFGSPNALTTNRNLMRDIFIILFHLLLTPPLYSQSKKTGVLYLWKNGTKYMGEWKVGKNTVREHTLIEKGNGKEKSTWGNSSMDIEMVMQH